MWNLSFHANGDFQKHASMENSRVFYCTKNPGVELNIQLTSQNHYLIDICTLVNLNADLKY